MRWAATASLVWWVAAFALAQPLAAQTPGPAKAAKPSHTTNTHALFAKSGIADWTKQPPAGPEPTFDTPHARRFKLPNGLSVLAIENHALPIVALTLLAVGAGSAADPQGQAGLAAYTADLLDEGAGGLSATAIAEQEARLGADVDIDVGADDAEISINTLSSTLEPTLDLLTKLITQPTFDAREAERVKGDRSTDLTLRRDRPREVAALMLNAALYGANTPYGHPTAGVSQEFARLGLRDAQKFYRERWQPATLTLVVAGDVESGQLEKSLRGKLGAWQPKPPAAKRAPPPTAAPAKLAQRLLLSDRRGAPQSDVRVGLVGPERKDARYFAFEVFRTLLGDGFTSRLMQRLREQLGITYGATADMHWRSSAGPFVIGSAIVSDETARGVAEILKLVDGLATDDVPAAELDKAKQNMIRALPAEFETNDRTADAFAELALLGLPDDWYSGYADGIRKVTATDVKAVAKALVPAGRLVFSVVGDLSKVKRALEQLGLGPALLHDPDGKPLAATAQ
jgi:zinc protease